MPAEPPAPDTAAALLDVLGPPRLAIAGRLAAPGARKAIALLAYLALEGRSTRAKLATLFWPELSGASARRNLRRELHRLRSAGAEQVLLDDGDTLALAPQVQVDALRFEQALAADALTEALALYRGPLLDGFSLVRPGVFEAWATQRRDLLAQRMREAVATQAARHEAAGRWRDALACHLRLVDDDLPQEADCRAAMRLQAMLGEREAALRLFERCRRALGRELGLRPMPETLALAEAVRSGEISAPPPLPAPTGPGADLLDGPLPFTGREGMLAAVQAAVAAGCTAWVLGEPGVGKTRLVHEAAARLGPHWLLAARGGDAAVPYATLSRILRDKLTPAVLATLPAGLRQDLAHLLPELGAAVGRLAGDTDRRRLHAAVNEALRRAWPADAVAVVFDDWHAADAATRGWWAEVAATGLPFGPHGLRRGTPGTVATARLLTARPGELPADLRQHLDRGLHDGRDAELALAPLSREAVEALLRALPMADEAACAALAGRLYAATAGNAFFVHETLRYLRQIGLLQRGAGGGLHLRPAASAADGLPLPPSVVEAVTVRLATLDAATRRLLEAASLAGGSFEAADLDGSTGLAGFEQVAALERACALGLLSREPAGALRFTHDLLPQSLAAALSPERRRLLHRRLAAALARHGGAPARVAWHLAQAGLPARALRWRLAAAEAAEAVAAHDQALAEYAAALACGMAPAEGARIRLRRALLLQRAGRPADADAEFMRAEQAAVAAGDGPGALAAQLAQAEHWGCTNRVDEALARVAGLLEDGCLQPLQQAQALEIRADALMRQGQAAASGAALDEALRHLPAGPSPQRGKLLLTGGRSRLQAGDLDGAALWLQRAVRVHTAVGALEPLAQATYVLGVVELHRGAHGPALDLLQRGRALAERAGSVPVQRGAILNQVKILTQTGRVEEALAALEAGEALSPVFETATAEAAFIQARYYCEVLRGDLGAARARLPAVLASADACVDLYWRVGARQLVVDLLLLEGELAQAARLLDEAAALCAGAGDELHRPLVRAKQAWLALRGGEPAAALARLDQARREAGGAMLAEAADVACHVEAAAHLALGDAAAALAAVPAPGQAGTQESQALQWAVRVQAEAALGLPLAASVSAAQALLAAPAGLPAPVAVLLRAVLAGLRPGAPAGAPAGAAHPAPR
ncbi:ATP-binding protein [Pseudorhodoferax sp.]|uniref:ATP-binding protein n=1 Tax=Pseudorhodoferax sp. TaxID=1993553 RepID=UPI002DD68743|nr:AAA family ATPase [Pseudorhodoferax sp.]